MNTERDRVALLLDAKAEAAELFTEIEARKPVAPGEGERGVSTSPPPRRPLHHPREQTPSDICSGECRN
ncbi:hypothetical protein ACFRAI_26740 [Streptomyces sp. NPDC056637]|uniref:hypothetical protein n=1 Tax=unclassified Streptomyces TaxID=2593676 RepID=UPI0036CF84DF